MQKFVLLAGVGCLLQLAPLTVQAQPGSSAPLEVPTVIDNGPREWRTIKLRYGKPSLMAWWLDPAHQPEPAEVAQGRRIEESMSNKPIVKPETEKTKGVFDLPAEVDEIKADDATYTLSALSSPKGLAELQKIVGFLDKPVAAVSISAALIEGDEKSLQVLTGPPVKGGQTGPLLSYVGKNAQARLDELIETGSARIVADFQFSTRNNIASEDTALLTAPDAARTTEPGSDLNLRLVVKPTVNLDNTITAVVHIVATDKGHADEPARPFSYDSLNAVVNIRNGDSVMLRGFDFSPWTRFKPEPEGVAPGPEKIVYLLLKGQILEGKRFH